MQIRTQFRHGSRMLTHWFPGHMAKALRVMRQMLASTHAVIEVHDARLPLTGRNPALMSMSSRPTLLVLNKSDLVGDSDKARLEKLLRRRNKKTRCLWVSCAPERRDSVTQIMPALLDILDNETMKKGQNTRIMVAGMPNVGKSSLINSLRHVVANLPKCAATGARPGITRQVSGKFKLHDDPPIYLLDTPGVMIPRIENLDVAMKLAAIGTLRDEIVQPDHVVDFLLFWMNNNAHFGYAEDLKLREPSDDIQIVLDQVAQNIGALLKGGEPDYDRASKYFLQRFRQGKFGHFALEEADPDSMIQT